MGPRSALLVAAAVGEKNLESEEPVDHALGRSRGGYGTKIHILCDATGRPLHFELSAGQVHDFSMLDTLLVQADKALLYDDGLPMLWPVALAGDKGYRAHWIDEFLLELGITPVIPCKENQDRSARLVPFDKPAYRRRSIIECLIGWLKESRRGCDPVREDRDQLRRDGEARIHPPLSPHLRSVMGNGTEPSNNNCRGSASEAEDSWSDWFPRSIDRERIHLGLASTKQACAHPLRS